MCQMVLECVDPAVDAGAVDHSGLTVLHRVAQGLDLAYLSLLLEERQKSQGEDRGAEHGVEIKSMPVSADIDRRWSQTWVNYCFVGMHHSSRVMSEACFFRVILSSWTM